MKTKVFVLAAAIALSATACNNANKQDAKEKAEHANDEKIDSRKMEKDAEFLVDAYECGMFEIQVAQLAAKNATLADVKAYAAQMETDHRKMGNEVTALAARKGITLPTALGKDKQDMLDDMSKMAGEKFDDHYADMSVDMHEKTIKKFEDESNNGTDADIKQLAGSSLPTLRTHFDNAKALQTAVDAHYKKK